MKKCFGEQSKPIIFGNRGTGPSIKIESALVTEEAYFANRSGYGIDIRDYFNGSGSARDGGFSCSERVATVQEVVTVVE